MIGPGRFLPSSAKSSFLTIFLKTIEGTVPPWKSSKGVTSPLHLRLVKEPDLSHLPGPPTLLVSFIKLLFFLYSGEGSIEEVSSVRLDTRPSESDLLPFSFLVQFITCSREFLFCRHGSFPLLTTRIRFRLFSAASSSSRSHEALLINEILSSSHAT